MDLKQKLEYQHTVESYLEDNEVYDLFEYLLKELLIDRPEAPIDYLISKLENPRRRRLFLVGGSGAKRRTIGKDICARFRVERISVIDLLKDEVKKAGKWSAEIKGAWQSGAYVPDDIVLDLLMPVIEEIEKQGKSYLLEGTPRTRVQSLALQRAGVIPDRIVMLQTSPEEYKNSFKEHYVDVMHPEDKGTFMRLPEVEEAAQRAIAEFQYNSEGVKAAYTFQCHEVESNGEAEAVADAVAKVFMVKGRTRAPRKPPRVVILGHPGSGRTTQAQEVARRYGLVLVSTSQLLRDQINRKTEIGKSVGALIQAGELVPDFIINELVKNRLVETDCKLNGWVLDGYPKTIEQCRSLKDFKIVPTHVFFLEATDTIVYERLENRCVDPQTGKFYSRSELPEDEELVSRLISLPEDQHEAIRKRLLNYKENATKLHAEYARFSNTIKADTEPELIADLIGESIENSVPHDFE